MRAELSAFVVALCLSTASHAQANGGRILGRRAVKPNVAIKAWNPAGSITFIGWDKDSIVMRGRVPRSRKPLFAGNALAMKIGVEGGWGGENDADTTRADLVVYVPRRASMSVKTILADITATDVGGWFYTVSGDIRLAGSASSATAESITGNLDLDIAAAWIKAQTGDGHLLLRGAAQDVDLSTVGGTLSIASSSVLRGQFSSVSGEIQYAAAPAAGAIFEFSDHSGGVDLLLPRSASATLMLFSVTGSIENGFTGVRPATNAPHSMRFNLGRGDAQISVRNFKGVIRVRPQ